MKKFFITLVVPVIMMLSGCVGAPSDDNSVPMSEAQKNSVSPIGVRKEDREDIELIKTIVERVDNKNERGTKIKVYFSTTKDNDDFNDCHKTSWVIRYIPKDKYIIDGALEELFKGPTIDERKNGLIPHILTPETAKYYLKHVIPMGDVPNVNFSTIYLDWGKVTDLMDDAGTTGAGCLFGVPIEQTLKALPSINKIGGAINGNPEDYYEWIQNTCKDFDDCNKLPYQNAIRNKDVIDLGYEKLLASDSSSFYVYGNKRLSASQVGEMLSLMPNERLFTDSNFPVDPENENIIYFGTFNDLENNKSRIYSYNLETRKINMVFELKNENIAENEIPAIYTPLASVKNSSRLIVAQNTYAGGDECNNYVWLQQGGAQLFSLDIDSRVKKLEKYMPPQYKISEEMDKKIRCLIDNGQ